MMSLHKRWQYFSEDELRCQGTGTIHMDEDFMKKLIGLRSIFNAPIIITSGFRSHEHNAAIGGAKDSPHTYGKAVDIKQSGDQALKLIELALGMGFTGIGVKQHGPHSSRFIHVDTMERSDRHPRPWIWSYK